MLHRTLVVLGILFGSIELLISAPPVRVPNPKRPAEVQEAVPAQPGAGATDKDSVLKPLPEKKTKKKKSVEPIPLPTPPPPFGPGKSVPATSGGAASQPVTPPVPAGQTPAGAGAVAAPAPTPSTEKPRAAKKEKVKPILTEVKPAGAEAGSSGDPRKTSRKSRRAARSEGRVESVKPMAPLRVMTYNLRFAGTNQPNSWTDRRPAARALVNRYKPDIIGTQEGLHLQLRDLEADLPGYGWVGLGREGGSKGEFMAVFYRRDRLAPMAFDHFWLSDTPLVMGSTTWGNQVRRMVTWVRFRDLKTGTEFFCFNTHFDHVSQNARERSAKLLGGMIASAGANAPVILLGDFNAKLADSSVHELLVKEGQLVDTWHYTREKRGELSGTFHDYGPVREDMGRIDWILTRGAWECDWLDTPRFSHRGQRPSDHWAVLAELRLRPTVPAVPVAPKP